MSQSTQADGDSVMYQRWDRVARRIKSFVNNPFTNLTKSVLLLLIGLTDVSHTFRDDITHGTVRLGHGLILIGLFGILDAASSLIESLEAWVRYHDLREKKERAEKGSDPP